VPLDGLKWNTPAVDVGAALSRRQRLIEALRDNPQPWDFRFHETCAMGLAVRMGIAPEVGHAVVGHAIGISADTAWRLFGSSWNLYRKRFLYFFVRCAHPIEVTPLMVADALEQIGEPLRGG
jgi:hypothetical protein